MSTPSDDDFEDGLRFVHRMSMQTKLDVADSNARLHGLITDLVSRGVVTLRSLEEHTERAKKEELERTRASTVVDVATTVDKYTITSPDVDCKSLMHLCKGRCCRLTFPLSFQDLDEGGLKWEYARPYQIRHDETGFCVHSDPATRGCTVYEKRPAVCRGYDCRTDKRIWADFANKVPAPWDAIALVTIRRKTPATPP